MGSRQAIDTRSRARWAGFGVAFLVLASLSGCSGATPDRSEAAEGVPAASTTSGSSAPSATPAQSDAGGQSEAESGASTSSASTEPSPAEAGASSSADETVGPETSPQESDPQPTLQQPPEPALSDDEIRETYGEDEPEPAEPVAGTLCNLSRTHLEGLSSQIVNDGAVDDGMLRLAALSLSDDLGVWEGISWQFPDLGAELDTARQIYAHWEYAIGLVDVGDADAALAELATADDLIEGLPGEDVAEVGC